MRLIIFILFGISCFSCEKREAKELEGTYYCTTYSHSWQMSSPPVSNYDTSYYALTVERIKKTLKVGGTEVPIEEILDEQIYTYGGYHFSGSIQFKNDMLYLESNNHQGLGGGNESTSSCHKTE